MENTEGPDFARLTSLGSLVLIGTSEPEKLNEIMNKVKDSIIEGTERVVRQQKMEDKYQDVAMNALKNGMRIVSQIFDVM